ncbi:MAG: peptidoglycan DD-metalloendopeptidase family protein [Alphaproteobacteria bacterium]|nr:peptidoglycan DD-metalloendopeptidase family protein [Alphaproteobacteria bacterium]
MVGGLRDLGERLFPERQLLVRSTEHVRSVLLPGWLQAMIAVACIGTLGGASYLTVGYFSLHRDVGGAAAVASSESAAPQPAAQAQANSEAQAVATLNQQLAAINGQYATLKQNYDAMVASQSAQAAAPTQQDLQQKLAAAQQQLSNNSGNVAQLKKSVDELHAELKRSEQARTAEATHTRQLEDAMQTLTARANLLKAIADSKDEQLTRLRAQLQKPGEQVGAIPPTSAPAPTAAPKASSDSLEPLPGKHSALAPETVGEGAALNAPAQPVVQLANHGVAHHATSRLEEVLASTGVDLDKIIGHISRQNEPAMGGPFVSLDSMRSNAAEQQRVAALLKVAKILPLRAPLDVRYGIGSPFGARTDPFNRRPEFHTGIDLDAAYRTTVYSTAPGVVIFTGWKEGYGRTIEIDHGHGIVTLYAHLHRILVANGERLAAHVKIGQLGSTGRSTGPHLHYEIRLDGRPVNPEKFLEAGKNVVQASAH